MNFLTLDEVAALLSLSRSTVYRLVRIGDIPCYKFGRRYRIREDQLAEYLEELTKEFEQRKALALEGAKRVA